eukprot:GHRR01022900.1.p1 GENE.GHRR01022900.1~~GHRR01022900.1.p1  ORF type:complete len:249 (+),score=106.48 GHRR01022900.1:277-1023(+)
MQIDSTDGPSSSSAPSTQTAAFTYGFNSSHFQQQQQQPFALASSMGYAGTEYQERPPRHRAPVGLFSSGLMPNSSNSIMHNNSIQQQGSSSMQLHGSNTSSLDGFPSSSLQSSITAAAEPSTPIGSPMKGANTGSASRSAAKGTGGLGSPSWFSPKSRVKYSDRFIPSRAATARLDFSALDREVVADQVNSSAQDREVSCSNSTLAVHIQNTNLSHVSGSSSGTPAARSSQHDLGFVILAGQWQGVVW